MSDQSQTKVAYEGKIIRVIETPLPGGRIREIAYRPYGTRTIVHRLSDDHILLNQEIRLDIGDDIRLPGGKIRDTNTEWDEIKNDPNLNDLIVQAAVREVREETGLELTDPRLFSVATNGAPTIDFNLYYIIANNFTDLGHQDLKEDEEITTKWFSVKGVIDICLTGKMNEGRSAAVLLQYLHTLGKI